MRHFRRTLVTALLALLGAPASASDAAIAERCRADLEFIPSFLLANDPGAPEHLRLRGEAAMSRALDDARAAVAGITSDEECLSALNVYVKSWRPGHLAVSPAVGLGEDGRPVAEEKPKDAAQSPVQAPSAQLPTIAFPSARTVVITVPTFHPDARQAIEALLATHAKRLAKAPNWILDLRTNDGGADHTYGALLAALAVNPRIEVGAEFLATSANIVNNDRVCAIYAPGDRECEAQLGALSGAMRAAPPGSYARPSGSAKDTQEIREHLSPADAPKRVAILIDRPCGSSCEQFLLSARQSYNVKLFGRRTAGSLDYSNLRPQDLPSGKRMLWYAISRSARLPHLPVDAAGIAPDVFLPPPADDQAFAAEIETVRRFLEE